MRPQTNIEKVVNLMEYSQFGALAQIFVIDALTKHAKFVAEADLSDHPNDGLVDMHAWQGVAQEIYDKLMT